MMNRTLTDKTMQVTSTIFKVGYPGKMQDILANVDSPIHVDNEFMTAEVRVLALDESNPTVYFQGKRRYNIV